MKMKLATTDPAVVKAVQAQALYAGMGAPEVTNISGVTTIAVETDEHKRKAFEAGVLQLDPGAERVD